MNRALAYAASRPNVLGTSGLINPFKSIPFATMSRLAGTIAAEGAVVVTEVLAIGDGLRKEWNAASSGECR
jgi:hypothetical protein